MWLVVLLLLAVSAWCLVPEYLRSKDPPRPKTIARTWLTGERLSDDEEHFIQDGLCPDCGGAGFFEGPCGGLAVNIKCAQPSCGSQFNIQGPFGTERLSDVRRPSEQKEPGQPALGPYRTPG